MAIWTSGYVLGALVPTLAWLSVAGALAQPSQSAAKASANCAATIQHPFDFAVLLDLNFGSIIAGNKAGTVTLDPTSGVRNCSAGGMVCVGSFSWSRLSISDSSSLVRISYSPSFALTGPGQPIIAELSLPYASGQTVLLTSGGTVIDIGAVLHVNSDQKPGAYNGSFAIDVSYE